MATHRSGSRRRSRSDVGDKRRRSREGKSSPGAGKPGGDADWVRRDDGSHVRGVGSARASSGSPPARKIPVRLPRSHDREVRSAGGRGKAAARLPARDPFGRFKARKIGRAGASSPVPKKLARRIQEKPAAKVSKKPVAKVSKKPAAKIPKKLDAKVSKKLVAKVSKKPAAKVPKKLAAKVSKKPAAKVPKKPAAKVPKKLAAKVSKKPVAKVPKKPDAKISKKPGAKISKKPGAKVSKKPAAKVSKKKSKKPKKPKKPARKRRRGRPRGPLPPLPAGAMEAETLMLSKLEEVMGLVTMMFPTTSMAIKSAINSDWTVDGELRVDRLPDELRTMDGMLEIIALMSEAFRAFRPFPQVPDMGGKFWASFGVRFGPNNETEIGKLEELYKKFRGLSQTGTYPAFAWNLSSIQSAIAPGLKTIFEGVATRMGIPPATLLIRFVWTPGPRKLWRDIPRQQQIKQRPGHWEKEGGKGR